MAMQINLEEVTADYQAGPIRSPEILKSISTTIKSPLQLWSARPVPENQAY